MNTNGTLRKTFGERPSFGAHLKSRVPMSSRWLREWCRNGVEGICIWTAKKDGIYLISRLGLMS